MSNPEDKAVIRCSNYAMKKAYRHWGNFADSDCSDLDEIDTALKYCLLAIKINPQNAAAYSLRGSMYNYKHWHKRAFRDLNKALSLGLNDEDVYYGLGFAHLLCEEYSQAVNNFSNAIALNPNSSILWYFRGCTFGDMELYDKAIPDLIIALSLDLNDTDTLDRLSNAYLERGHYHLKAGRNLEAINDFTSATSSRDFIVEAYEGRFAAFTNLGRVDEASADMAKAKYFREEQEHSKKNSHD